MISVLQPFRLWMLGRKLRLGIPSACRLTAAYYFGRRRILKRLFTDSVVINAPGFGKIGLRTNGYDHELLEQIFIQEDYKFKAPNVRRILDLGANIGMSALYLHKQFPEAEIACVEPSPHNYALLKQTIGLNNINARVFEAAIGHEDGKLELFLSSYPDCNSMYRADDSESSIVVPMISVPSVMREMGWDSIDLVKIDIEGAEKLVFGQNSSWLKSVRHIVGESHIGVGYSYSELKHDLERFGFVLQTRIEESAQGGATFTASRTLTPV